MANSIKAMLAQADRDVTLAFFTGQQDTDKETYLKAAEKATNTALQEIRSELKAMKG